MDLLAALSLGLIGSIHCIGMCGPLLLVVPSVAQSRTRFLFERILYNTGRSITYGILGLVIGLIGKTILVNIQQDLSIVLGISILLTVAIPFGLKTKIEKYLPLKYAYVFVKEKFSLLLKRRGLIALFTLGMLNGLLPCGLVYTALIGAVVVADSIQSALFMTVFGLGTLPALVVIMMTGKLISIKFRSNLRRAIPIFSVVLAVVLILRGMNLGIPMISPSVQHPPAMQSQQSNGDCCK